MNTTGLRSYLDAENIDYIFTPAVSPEDLGSVELTAEANLLLTEVKEEHIEDIESAVREQFENFTTSVEKCTCDYFEEERYANFLQEKYYDIVRDVLAS